MQTSTPVTGSLAGGLNLAAAIAYTDVPTDANAGYKWSSGIAATGGQTQVLNHSALGRRGRLRVGRGHEGIACRAGPDAAGDSWAVAASKWGSNLGCWSRAGQDYQRAATDYASATRFDKVGDTWDRAAGEFAKSGALQMVGIAYHLSAAGYAQIGRWDKAAQQWERSGQNLAKSTTGDWANVAYEYAANAWVNQNAQTPGLDAQTSAVKDFELAAGGWVSLAVGRAQKVDQGAVLRGPAATTGSGPRGSGARSSRPMRRSSRHG